MATLPRELRRSLENTVREARRVAEVGARKVIEQLAVHHHEPYTSMTPEQRDLRNALRAHGRQLGDRRDTARGIQAIDRLTTECAYEHWHRMLFARFLAETNLLIEPESGMDITLEDCQELARERGEDWLELASQFAERMLPQIFRTNDPVLKVALPPETRAELEKLLNALARDVFIADDSLGWVYQYWQADKKDEVNRSEKKIGADELPAVTQLFTEDYMVFFLLHNTLGAWWAGKVLAAKPELALSAKSEEELRAACVVGGIDWAFLRFVREEGKSWRPTAGTFDGWPKAAKDITLLDPCMGSGHFLVFALPMLAAMRAAEERLSEDAAIEAVLRDNLFGLEIDPRCTQIAAFNVALAAWRRIGYRQLPALQLACSGLSLGVSKSEWLTLAARAAQALPVPPKSDLLGTEDNLFSDAMKRGFERVYDLFARAPWLGSLIDPGASGGDLVEHGFADLEPLLAQVMAKAEIADLSEMAVAAQGLAKAAKLLRQRFTLIVTNVPFLGNRRQSSPLMEFSEQYFQRSKVDLSVTMLDRLISSGLAATVAAISPQAWLQQIRYRKFLEQVILPRPIHLVLRYGSGAFQTISGEVVSVCAAVVSTEGEAPSSIEVLDLSKLEGPQAKERESIVSPFVAVETRLMREKQTFLFQNPEEQPELGVIAFGTQGVKTGDDDRFVTNFWELPKLGSTWRPYIGTASALKDYSGRNGMLRWEDDGAALIRSRRDNAAFGRIGVAINQMGQLLSFIYTGEAFDSNVAPIVCHDVANTPALLSFIRSRAFGAELGKLEGGMKINNGTILRVPFDLAHWQRVAANEYPDGLPAPYSSDPTQWLFNGHPKGSDAPLQVAVARLVGYRWPRQTGSGFPKCPALGTDGLENFGDRDGIVPLNPVKGEQSAAARLTGLLADAFGEVWSAAKLETLLAQAGFSGKTIDDWLRDGFFEQHCALFLQRPFIWHIWDGRRDGFHALVNCHRLAAPNGEGRRTLEKLLYSYLGDWIDRQRADQIVGVDGADARVAAAEHLKVELTNILAGEPPYDLFVRWKPLREQPIGWEPDVNDGVRMNIRPFIIAKPLGARARGACVLRVTPKVKWDKDRGKEPQRSGQDFPWFWGWDETTVDFPGGRTFDGNRWNDLHYSRAAKEVALARRMK